MKTKSVNPFALMLFRTGMTQDEAIAYFAEHLKGEPPPNKNTLASWVSRPKTSIPSLNVMKTLAMAVRQIDAKAEVYTKRLNNRQKFTIQALSPEDRMALGQALAYCEDDTVFVTIWPTGQSD